MAGPGEWWRRSEGKAGRQWHKEWGNAYVSNPGLEASTAATSTPRAAASAISVSFFSGTKPSPLVEKALVHCPARGHRCVDEG